jgi:hypothetical protein
VVTNRNMKSRTWDEKLAPTKEWTAAITPLVETALESFIWEFLHFPYLHRVEHSLHCSLYHHLSSLQALSGTQNLGNVRTGYIHKEWPTAGKSGQGVKRGNFDLAIIGPPAKGQSADADDFDLGIIPPAIVIEVGLNYRVKHLKGDIQKMEGCWKPISGSPTQGILLHLARGPRESAAVEDLVLQTNTDAIKSGTRIKAAYVHHFCAGKVRVCRLGETAINEESVASI